MDHGTFLRQAERGQIAPVVLVHGDDAQLLDDVLAAAGRALFPDPGHAAFDRDVFDAREADAETILSAARTLPVLAAARLVVVRHAEALAQKSAAAVGAYIKDPNPGARLLLLAAEPLAASWERKTPHWLLAAVPSAAIVQPVVRRGRAVEEWLRQRAAAEGLTVSAEAAHALVEAAGEDGAVLLGEVRKAALAGGPDNHAVGIREVEAVVGDHRVHDVFELLRAIHRHEVGRALRTLDRLLAIEDPMRLMVMLVRELRTVWSVREWRRQGRPDEQIARMLRRPPAAVEALAASAAAESDEGLARKLRRCWEVEHRLKSRSEPRAEMAALIVDLAS